MSDAYNQGGFVQPAGGQRSNGMAVAAFVLGLVSVVLMCVWYIAITCGVLGIVFGVVGRNNARNGASGHGMATAGMILGVFGLVLPPLLFLGCLTFVGLGSAAVIEEAQKAAQQMQNQSGVGTP